MPQSRQKDRIESREPTVLRAKIVADRGGGIARISNLSWRGFSAVMDDPPPRGEFIDIEFPAAKVAGQVRWVAGRKFGVHLGERVDPLVLTGQLRPERKLRVHATAIAAKQPMSLGGTLVAYSVMGLTALCTAYLIVTYFT